MLNLIEGMDYKKSYTAGYKQHLLLTFMLLDCSWHKDYQKCSKKQL